MIRITRGPPPAGIGVYAPSVKTALSPAQAEVARAVDFFTDPRNYAGDRKLTKRTFAFRIYKDTELAEALEQVFGPKCAYCESRFAHVTPKDIEHFRPKSEIDTGQGSLAPGYFWLAAEWENLLVSCPDCNRGRRFEVPGQPKRIRLGKATQFPLRNEGGRIRTPAGKIGSEEALRLLINPTKDQPERHLTFNEEGLVLPREDRRGTPSRKGAASITVYALQRKHLVEERGITLNQLRTAVRELVLAAQARSELKKRGITGLLLDNNTQSIRLIKRRLNELLRPDAEFLGILRDWLRKQEGMPEFKQLEACHIDLSAMAERR
jgi:uncharacterized protein (TIGR02646 family)